MLTPRLDGGGFMVPVLQSEIADAITDGIHDTVYPRGPAVA